MVIPQSTVDYKSQAVIKCVSDNIKVNETFRKIPLGMGLLTNASEIDR